MVFTFYHNNIMVLIYVCICKVLSENSFLCLEVNILMKMYNME